MKRSKLRKRFLKVKSEACAKAYITQRNCDMVKHELRVRS